MFLEENIKIHKFFWLKWALLLFVVAILFISFIHIAPPALHADEFMTIDLGRIILHPKTDWSITWLAHKKEPVILWFYLGTVLQEFSFQFIGQYGPRLSSLGGAFVATTALIGWIHSRGTSLNASILLGLVFVFDPLFVQAYSVGRVDGWAMAFSLISCWILRDTSNKSSNNNHFSERILIGGAFLSIAFFTWPSAVFLFPLIFLELIYLVSKFRFIFNNWKKAVIPISLFVLGSLLMGIILVLPIAPLIYSQISNIIEGVQINTRSGLTSSEKFGIHAKLLPFIDLLRVLKFSPIVVILAIFAIVKKQQFGLLITMLIACLMMIFTLVYNSRVQYLLPYFIASIAVLYQWKNNVFNNKQIASRFQVGGIVVLLSWAIGLSLCIRSLIAFEESTDRDRKLIFDGAKLMVGVGSHTVFCPPEFYYVGRNFGWKMYLPYLPVGSPTTKEVLKQMMPQIDYAIIPKWRLTNDFIEVLNEEKMIDNGWYFMYKDSLKDRSMEPANIKRLRNLYSIPYKPYGPYKVYVRNISNETTVKVN